MCTACDPLDQIQQVSTYFFSCLIQRARTWKTLRLSASDCERQKENRGKKSGRTLKTLVRTLERKMTCLGKRKGEKKTCIASFLLWEMARTVGYSYIHFQTDYIPKMKDPYRWTYLLLCGYHTWPSHERHTKVK